MSVGDSAAHPSLRTTGLEGDSTVGLFLQEATLEQSGAYSEGVSHEETWAEVVPCRGNGKCRAQESGAGVEG